MFKVGKVKKDVLEQFILEELNEYLDFRKHRAYIYDAIVQKYTN
jgi:hypothetical protein